MADTNGKLVFWRPAGDSGKLVFGEEPGGGGPGIPDAPLAVDADLPGLTGPVGLRSGSLLAVDASLPGMEGGAVLVWDANASRSTLARAAPRFEQATPLCSGIRNHWQTSLRLASTQRPGWQQGQPAGAAVRPRWQRSLPVHGTARPVWQQGLPAASAARAGFQQALVLRAAARPAWQQGQPVVQGWQLAFQQCLRVSLNARIELQQGVPLSTVARSGLRAGLPLWRLHRPGFQQARYPLPGITHITPPVRPPQLCYDPARRGILVFDRPRSDSGKLLFVCQRPGQVLPPATVVILPRRSYILINSVEIRRADALGGDPLPAENFQMQLDRRSWSWSWSASFHASAREAVTPSLVSGPVELEVRVNGQPFRLMSETVGRSRRLPEHLVAARGRGKAAVLDAPHAEVQTFGSALDRTAHQLMTEVLTVNGVGFGWSVDFQLTDWLVPGGVWMHQGTWISALADIASSVGGYLQPHDTEPILRVLPSWPAPWWEWAGMTPDVELPAGVGEFEEVEIIDLPGYNRIIVSGQAGGIAADLTRNGTAGDVLKQPMAVHPLITTIGAAKQRARAELSGSGRGLHHKLLMPVHPAAGVIKPGTILRFTDDENAIRLGLVRSTSVSEAFPVLTQNLEIESHA